LEPLKGALSFCGGIQPRLFSVAVTGISPAEPPREKPAVVAAKFFPSWEKPPVVAAKFLALLAAKDSSRKKPPVVAAIEPTWEKPPVVTAIEPTWEKPPVVAAKDPPSREKPAIIAAKVREVYVYGNLATVAPTPAVPALCNGVRWIPNYQCGQSPENGDALQHDGLFT
jgi:hypothetical protein